MGNARQRRLRLLLAVPLTIFVALLLLATAGGIMTWRSGGSTTALTMADTIATAVAAQPSATATHLVAATAAAATETPMPPPVTPTALSTPTMVPPTALPLTPTPSEAPPPSPTATLLPPTVVATSPPATATATTPPGDVDEPTTPIVAPTSVLATVRVPALNLRTGPGLNFPVIASLSQGSVVTLTGASAVGDGYFWIEIIADGAHGWAIGEPLGISPSS